MGQMSRTGKNMSTYKGQNAESKTLVSCCIGHSGKDMTKDWNADSKTLHSHTTGHTGEETTVKRLKCTVCGKRLTLCSIACTENFLSTSSVQGSRSASNICQAGLANTSPEACELHTSSWQHTQSKNGTVTFREWSIKSSKQIMFEGN